MATSEYTLNSYCRRGYNVNHSCRQCLKRTLEAYGYDAEEYDAEALRATCAKRSKAHHQRWHVKGDSEVSHKHRLWKYGLTKQQYTTLLALQNGVCALCHHEENRRKQGTLCSLAVDHDHTTGKVRGLLCAGCNSRLGMFEHQGMRWILQAEQYLIKAGSAAPTQHAVFHAVFHAALRTALDELDNARHALLHAIETPIKSTTVCLLTAPEDRALTVHPLSHPLVRTALDELDNARHYLLHVVSVGTTATRARFARQPKETILDKTN